MGEISDDTSLLDRIRHWAKEHVPGRTSSARRNSRTSILPTAVGTSSRGDGTESRLRSETHDHVNILHTNSNTNGNAANRNEITNPTATSSPLPGPPPHTETHGEKFAAVTTNDQPGWLSRMHAGSIRFLHHTKDALTHSWINALLVFVPIGIAVNWIPISGTSKATIVFALNAVAIIPLAGLLSHATESVASRMGDTWASLLNVTFGNAVELIIFVYVVPNHSHKLTGCLFMRYYMLTIALVKNEIRIVQASILGSILANLLLILGMAFLFGGLRFREQIYNSTVTQMSACLLSLSVMSLLLPTAFHASFSDSALADERTTQISRGTSVVLLLVYILYLLFQLKSHAYMYESTPQSVIDEEARPGVLAEMLNSSSSSDASSGADSDSDTSSNSQTTTRKRIKRAFRQRLRRKSNASSTLPASVLSVSRVPSDEKRSVTSAMDGSTTPATEGYFDQQPQPPASVFGGNVFSGDEADLDDYHGPATTVTRVRDFEIEQGGGSKSPPASYSRKDRKKGKKRHRKIIHEEETENQIAEKAGSAVLEATHSARSGQIESIDYCPMTVAPEAKLPFTRRPLTSIGAFRPPLTSLLTNNVFATSTPSQGVTIQPLSVARNAGLGLRTNTTNLRRTSSLPDRLVPPARGAAAATSVQPSRRTATFAVNEADAIKKDNDEDIVKPTMSRTAAVMLLLVSTGLVAFCAELLVDSIPAMIAQTTVSQAFIGLIILPIVGNAAEHVTAVTVATKNKMDLAIGVAVGSSIQIALFVTPFVVLLGWCLNKDMSLYFNLFETVSLFATAFVVNFLVLDGRSNYLEGSLLIAAYVIIAVAAFFYPNLAQQSQLGGSLDQAASTSG